jgi:fused signal recognition particle receptor
VGISGLVITKLDGTARGGVVVSIVRDLGLPVKLIGVGEGINDLRDFDPATFVDALLGYEVRIYCFLAVRLSTFAILSTDSIIDLLL